MTVSFLLTVYFMKKHPEGEEDKGEGKGLNALFGKKKNKKAEAIPAPVKEEKKPDVAQITIEKEDLAAPFDGTVKPIAQCADPVFASKAMGDGIVIEPENDLLTSPVDGEVMMIFPTRHAIGLKADNGAEILIHIGMDTVSLEGKPFEVLVEAGQKIKAGQPLIRVDFDEIRKAGLSTQTPVIITNAKSFDRVKEGKVKAGDVIVKVKD